MFSVFKIYFLNKKKNTYIFRSRQTFFVIRFWSIYFYTEGSRSFFRKNSEFRRICIYKVDRNLYFVCITKKKTVSTFPKGKQFYLNWKFSILTYKIHKNALWFLMFHHEIYIFIHIYNGIEWFYNVTVLYLKTVQKTCEWNLIHWHQFWKCIKRGFSQQK